MQTVFKLRVLIFTHQLTEIQKTEPQKPMKIKEIKIRQCDHGYILNVGCKEIALDTPEKIIFGLKLYLNNPEKVEKAFLEGKFKFEK